MSWADLFERAGGHETDPATVREALARRRERVQGESGRDAGASAGGVREGRGLVTDASPARVVADADVLAADLLVGGPARDALDQVRAHSWVVLVASDPLLDDAEAVIADLSDADLASDWREQIERECERVEHPPGDHPALAAAYHGGAMHVLTFDEGLQSATAGAAIRERVETSVKHPAAFARLFDPAALYPAVIGGEYPGPDRDPRA